jgi:hypothetical protein
MFRESFTAAGICKVVLLATAIIVSGRAASDPRTFADVPCQQEVSLAADAVACHQVPPASRWDPNESGLQRPGVYYQP